MRNHLFENLKLDTIVIIYEIEDITAQQIIQLIYFT